MTFSFFSNYFNHHQKALCDALYERLGSDFHFIETEPIEAFRSAMGWGQEEVPDYVLKAHEDASKWQQALELGQNSDVVMIGSAPELFVKERIAGNKLTFRYTERPMKEGVIKMFIPRLAKKFYHLHYRNRNKNVYLLGASAYAAADYKILHSYPDKCYQFGYFPAIDEISEEELMKKKTNSPAKILWTGRFLKLKRADLLIQAAEQLKKKEIPFQIEFIGNGEEEEHLKKLVKDKQLLEQISFRNFLAPTEVRQVMEEADIYVMTSNFLEGWGAVIYEGLSAGCAVVASHACGSAPWLIHPGENGFLFQSGSSKSLADKLERLLTDEVLMERCKKAAYRQMRKLWNPDVAAKRLLELSCSLLAGENLTFAEGPLAKAPVIKNNWYHEK